MGILGAIRTEDLLVARNEIMSSSDILFRFGRFLCVNAYFRASIHLILFFVSNHGKQLRNIVNKTEKSTIKISRFEIVDGVKYIYCIKHAYKFLLREQVGLRLSFDACVNVFLVSYLSKHFLLFAVMWRLPYWQSKRTECLRVYASSCDVQSAGTKGAYTTLHRGAHRGTIKSCTTSLEIMHLLQIYRFL